MNVCVRACACACACVCVLRAVSCISCRFLQSVQLLHDVCRDVGPGHSLGPAESRRVVETRLRCQVKQVSV